MLLHNIEIVESSKAADIYIQHSKIDAVGDSIVYPANEAEIYFEDAIAFPGIVNSHDHLDFNLFPQLGNRVYSNYVEWGDDIHLYNKDVINKVLKIPRHLRIQWGIYKNLVNGVTTVVNHGDILPVTNDVITVFQQYHFLHSIQLEKIWKYKLNKPFRERWPFAIHIGEGSDSSSSKEIDELIKWNIRNKEIVGIHGIAMNMQQAAHFKAVTWCPVSNFFLMGKTAAIRELKQATTILFGTDATVSAGWNLWEHLRTARDQHLVSDAELYDMLTTSPARIWNLRDSGKVKSGYDADIVIARRKKGMQGYDAYYALNPEDILLVIHKGKIRLFDVELLEQINSELLIIEDFNKIVINGSLKYIYGDIPALMKEIRHYYKEADFPLEGY